MTEAEENAADLAIVKEIEALLVSRVGPTDGDNFPRLMTISELVLIRVLARVDPSPPTLMIGCAMAYDHLVALGNCGEGILNV